MSNEHVLSVEDHGMWRGHHRWTVRIEGPTGRVQVEARGDTEEKATADALTTYRNRRVFSDEERETMQRTNAALAKGISGGGGR